MPYLGLGDFQLVPSFFEPHIGFQRQYIIEDSLGRENASIHMP